MDACPTAPRQSLHTCSRGWLPNGSAIAPRFIAIWLTVIRSQPLALYSGTYRKIGKALTASFSHLYRLKNGKIASMEPYVDSAMVRDPASGARVKMRWLGA